MEERHLTRHDIRVLPLGEREALFVDIPTSSQNLEMMLYLLVHRCNCALSYRALKLIVHCWEDVPVSAGAAEGLLLEYLLRHDDPLSVVSAVLMAMRSEILDLQKKKPTSHLEDGLRKFSRLQILILGQLQELMRGSGSNQGEQLQRMISVLDPKPMGQTQAKWSSLDDKIVPHKESEGPLTLSNFRPLRVAFADSDAEFVATPLVESFTRLAWCDQEYVMETCKDGHNFLSMLNPAMMFLVLCDLGFCTKALCMPLELKNSSCPGPGTYIHGLLRPSLTAPVHVG